MVQLDINDHPPGLVAQPRDTTQAHCDDPDLTTLCHASHTHAHTHGVGFACAGLRGGQHIAAFQRRGNGAVLHRSGRDKVVGGEPRLQRGRKGEL